MKKIIINTIKTIAKLGGRELRYTEMNGEQKFDIRAWNGDQPDDGVRFSQDEMNQLYAGIKENKFPFEVGNKTCVIDDSGDYALSLLFNGRTYVRPFATATEMKKLVSILDVAKDNLLEYKEQIDDVKTNKSISKSETKSADKTPKKYMSAYEKFKDQFEEYRNTQPDNRKKGYELTHNLILEHIKDICKTSDEYNKNGLQEWKNTGNMMRFCQDKAFENAEALMNVNTREEASELMFQWVDEYIGADDKPKVKPSTKQSDTTTKAKRGRPKKG